MAHASGGSPAELADSGRVNEHGEPADRRRPWPIRVLALAYAGYFLWCEVNGPLPGLEHRVVVVTGAVSLALLAFPPKRGGMPLRILNGLAIVATVATGIYVFEQFGTFASRVGLPPTVPDIGFGTIAFVVLLLAAKRTIGWDFPIVTGLFMLYCFVGPWLPSVLHHNGFTYQDFIGAFFLSSEGPYGSLTDLASYIVLFVIFSAFMQASGMTVWLTQIAARLLGRTRGGAAKISVIGSSMTGAITGVSTANVAGVGSITIPMMKRSGYSKESAAAIEASSGMGAQIMPPLMGAAIFIMVELVGVSYWTIASSAFLIGVLFYLSLFVTVDLQAVKQGGSRLDSGALEASDGVGGEVERVSFGRLFLNGGHHLIAPVVLVYSLGVLRVSPGRSALYALIVAAVILLITKRSWRAPLDLLKVVADGIFMGLPILAVLAAASFMAGVVTVTGVGVEMSSSAIDIAGGSLFLLLLLAALCSLVLGLGAPTLVSYSVVAVLIAPALVEAGVPELGAHLFVFYFAVLSIISPPVAPDPFVAAAIAGASPMRVAFRSMRIGAVLFVVPFVAVYKPALLLDGPPYLIVAEFVLAGVGVYCWAAGFEGVMLPSARIGIPMRLILVALGSTVLVAPAPIALVAGGAVVALHVVRRLVGTSPDSQPSTSPPLSPTSSTGQ
jgi:TRAP transporter 4TM/12TM fusion protein